VEIRMLGPIEFWASQKRQDLGSAKERLLLAILLLAEGRPVPIETLIDRIWGENPPAEARHNLHTDIYRLRRCFRRCKVADEVWIAGTHGAYTLELDPENVDLFRSRGLRERAARSRRNGDLREAAKLLREAVRLWRAEPLTGISSDWVDRARAGLDSEFRAMALELVEIELATGNHAEIIGFLVELKSRYPLDESFIKQLMIAYYGCGRHADAIAEYDTIAYQLREDLATAPTPELQGLYRKIRRHDRRPHGPRRRRGRHLGDAGRRQVRPRHQGRP
jgi:DNA-binding SARP family transcriptional activator